MLPQFENITLSKEEASLKIFQRKERHFQSYWHFHPEMELTYIVRGEGLRHVGDSIENFSSGDLVLLGKNIPHNWQSFSDESTDGVEAVVIQFSENIFSGFPEFRFFNPLIQQAGHGLELKAGEELLGEIRSLCEYDKNLQLIKFLDIFYRLSQIRQKRCLSGEKFSFDRISKMESRINRAREFIDLNIKGSIKLQDVAAHMKMTQSYFCRWFKKNTGHSLVRYINTLKIELVCRELVLTDKDISVIAYETGFENISHFNRIFKRLKNVSPSTYRLGNRRI
ncbi:MAG TPA: AraC family transcriptional regulator [Salinimicrobium sp.]|nr:AraC family transcriptional regulator [Salinimicrobium sp.]